jgi:hypothetical protein
MMIKPPEIAAMPSASNSHAAGAEGLVQQVAQHRAAQAGRLFRSADHSYSTRMENSSAAHGI